MRGRTACWLTPVLVLGVLLVETVRVNGTEHLDAAAAAMERKHSFMRTPELLNADHVRRPYMIPQTSQSCSATGRWLNIALVPNHTCHEPLLKLFGKRDRRMPFRAVTMGDSTMYRLTGAITAVMKTVCAPGSVVKRSSGKCSIEKYIGIKDKCPDGGGFKEAEFCMTNTHEVLSGPTCYDCSNCDSSLWESAKSGDKNGGGRQCSLEYISLMSADPVPPFPRQTHLSTSTKEAGVGTGQNIAYYLAHAPRAPHDVCLVNSGFHDEFEFRNMSIRESAPQFAKHVRNHIHHLLPGCRRVIWLSINAARDETLDLANWFQANDEIEEWNMAVANMILEEQEFQDRVLFFDIYNLSHYVGGHADNLHMKPIFYSVVAKLLFRDLV